MENLLSQAQAVLSTTTARWLSLTETIPSELLTRSPAPKEWSALECLQHLLDTEQWVFPVRVQAFLTGQDFPGFDPDSQGRKLATAQEPVALAREFANLRVASLQLLAKVTPADLSRTARHSELGQVTLAAMLHEWAAHDLMHTVQAERAVMQPFIVGSGPWRRYFVDHDVEAHTQV
jgi:hypothetical protein